jgi:hypothetical protein
MIIEPKKTYNQTFSKLRILWNIAQKLIGEYEDYDRRLIELENKYKTLSNKISMDI